MLQTSCQTVQYWPSDCKNSMHVKICEGHNALLDLIILVSLHPNWILYNCIYLQWERFTTKSFCQFSNQDVKNCLFHKSWLMSFLIFFQIGPFHGELLPCYFFPPKHNNVIRARFRISWSLHLGFGLTCLFKTVHNQSDPGKTGKKHFKYRMNFFLNIL